MTGSTLEHPVVDTTPTTWDDYEKAYRGEDENPWVKSDLSYFFGGSLTDAMASDDCKVYTNEIEEVTGKNLAGEEETVLVGRQFLTQYPSDMKFGSIATAVLFQLNIKNVGGDLGGGFIRK